MTEYTWSDPPTTGRRDWPAVIAELDKNPGRWMKVHDKPTSYSSVWNSMRSAAGEGWSDRYQVRSCRDPKLENGVWVRRKEA